MRTQKPSSRGQDGWRWIQRVVQLSTCQQHAHIVGCPNSMQTAAMQPDVIFAGRWWAFQGRTYLHAFRFTWYATVSPSSPARFLRIKHSEPCFPLEVLPVSSEIARERKTSNLAYVKLQLGSCPSSSCRQRESRPQNGRTLVAPTRTPVLGCASVLISSRSHLLSTSGSGPTLQVIMYTRQHTIGVHSWGTGGGSRTIQVDIRGVILSSLLLNSDL
jgi:hypothetical protein